MQEKLGAGAVMTRWLLLLVMVLGALAFRLPQLDQRPLHSDENMNASKLLPLWEKGQCRYDPNEYHGPALHYFSLPFLWLGTARDASQLDDTALRLPAVFLGVALIPLLVLLLDGLGWGAILSAGALTAISPAMVFYSRYFIQEMLLVFLALLLVSAAWRYSRSPRLGWAVLGGSAVGLMYATKETFVLNVAALIAAVLATRLVDRRREHVPLLPPAGPVKRSHLLVAAVVALAVAVLFFSSFFTNARGPLDALRTYLPWIKRAAGQTPHLHPWHYYLERLFWFRAPGGPRWSEGLILALAIAGSVAAFMRESLPGVNAFLARSLVFYTWFLAAIYSAISYKTPWCLLGFLQPMTLVAGIGVVALTRWSKSCRVKLLVGALLIAAGTHLGWQAYRASFVLASDWRNPYVYAQTLPDIYRLVQRVEAVAKVYPEVNRIPIKVVSDVSYWPLPWYLRRFERVGWQDTPAAERQPPPMVILNARFQAYRDDLSGRGYVRAGHYEFRPTVFFDLYVAPALWARYVSAQ